MLPTPITENFSSPPIILAKDAIATPGGAVARITNPIHKSLSLIRNQASINMTAPKIAKLKRIVYRVDFITNLAFTSDLNDIRVSETTMTIASAATVRFLTQSPIFLTKSPRTIESKSIKFLLVMSHKRIFEYQKQAY